MMIFNLYLMNFRYIHHFLYKFAEVPRIHYINLNFYIYLLIFSFNNLFFYQKVTLIYIAFNIEYL